MQSPRVNSSWMTINHTKKNGSYNQEDAVRLAIWKTGEFQYNEGE